MADRNSYPDYHHLVVDWRSSLITVPMGAVTVAGSGKAPLVRAGLFLSVLQQSTRLGRLGSLLLSGDCSLSFASCAGEDSIRCGKKARD
jgi:hypothetical protein